MSKNLPIDTISQAVFAVFLAFYASSAVADDSAAPEKAVTSAEKAEVAEVVDDAPSDETDEKSTAPETFPADYWTEATAPVYPRGIGLAGNRAFVLDSDAHGVWVLDVSGTLPADVKLFATGSRYLRKTMNRPFSVATHPDSGVLVGDAATREIYHVVADKDSPQGQKITALNNGYLGIPMAIAVSPDEKKIYVGDAERRAVFELPIDGAKPELVVRVNARGLVFDAEGALWAVTPDAEAVYKIDVEAKTAKPVVTERPYGFPGGIALVNDDSGTTGYVSDVYGKCIWKFTPDGKTEKWFEGDTLKGPVGITATKEHVWVADPKTKQLYRIDRESKEATPMMVSSATQ